MLIFNNDSLALQGLNFFDADDNLILEVGKQDPRFLVKEVLLQENERIVGFESKNSYRP